MNKLTNIMIGANEFMAFPQEHMNICSIVMPLFVANKNHFKPLGTCFSITCDGVILTALHVITEAFPEVDFSMKIDRTVYGELFARYYDDKKDKYYIIKIQNIFYNLSLDIAVLYGVGFDEENAQIEFPVCPISATFPKIGENVLGIGYHKSSYWVCT